LLIDPNGLEEPDYASDDHAAVRQPWITAGLTQEQVIALLTNAWRTANAADIARWQAQIEAAEQAARDSAAAAAEADNLRREQERQEEEQDRKDERKKYKGKFTKVPRRPPPAGELNIAAAFALRRLDKGEYVELHYFTNAGLDAADASFAQTDDEALVMRRGEDGSPTWAPAAAARGTKAVTPDQDLTTEQLWQAVPRFIKAMEEAHWDPDRMNMLADFWGNLHEHAYAQSRVENKNKAILIYQAEQRRAWHRALNTPKGAWDISIIVESLLLEAYDKAYRLRRD
ncbi:uncharacterized protein C8Q71DRAFT_693639, partial [Rhodofomes roseus]